MQAQQTSCSSAPRKRPPGHLRPDLAGRARDRRADPGTGRGHGHPPAGRGAGLPGARARRRDRLRRLRRQPAQRPGLPYGRRSMASSARCRPGWCRPDGRTWAIVVHGINGNPQDGLRVAPVLRRTGLPALYITYRDDHGAPESPDGLPPHGADRVARSGGGGALRPLPRRPTARPDRLLDGRRDRRPVHGELAPGRTRVDALVLDAPVLDWRKTIEFNATEMGFPGFAAIPVEWAIGARIDADWESLDAIRHPRTSNCRSSSSTAPTTTSSRSRPAMSSPRALPAAGHLLPRPRRRPHGELECGSGALRKLAADSSRSPCKSAQSPAHGPPQRSEPDRGRARAAELRTGGDLLSQGVAPQVPSAQSGLTALFGMGRGVSHSLCATGILRDVPGGL